MCDTNSKLFFFFFFFFFFFTVTYHGRRDADYTVVIGSRATGTASCLVLLLCYLAGFHTATGQGGQLPFSSWRHSPHTSPQGVAEPTDSGLTTKGDMPHIKAKNLGFFFCLVLGWTLNCIRGSVPPETL